MADLVPQGTHRCTEGSKRENRTRSGVLITAVDAGLRASGMGG